MAVKMPEATFETEIRDVPGLEDASTLSIRGRIRYPQAPALRRSILDWIASAPASRLIIELEDVDEMDTSGAAVLVESLLYGRDRSKQMLLCSPSESVLRLFHVSGFEEALKACCPSPAEALRRLQV
jgi:anti-anti-sigma factor